MKKISLNEVIKAVDGEFSGDSAAYINQLFYDSRDVVKNNKNSLFVAIPGNEVNGHKFVISAFENGAKFALVDHKPNNIKDTSRLIFVEDTVQAFGKLAKYYKSKFDLKTIGITGSVGKTLTKEFIANVLSQELNTYRNQGNFNSLVGLPYALQELKDEHEVAVIELATNHFGEIAWLTDIIKPDISIITNIEEVHTEFLENLRGVYREKIDIFKNAKEDAIKIFDGDEFLFQDLKKKENYLSFGLKEDNDYIISEIKLENDHYSFYLNNEKYQIFNDFEPNVFNATPAIIIGKLHNINSQQIQAGLNIEPGLDLRIDKKYNDEKNWEIIADCYNANPKAMKASLEYLKQVGYEHTIAILGDMLELGEKEVEKHKEIGEFIKTLDLDRLITVGDLARYFKGDEHYNSVEEILAEKDEFKFPQNSAILLKGSRFIELEKLMERLID